MSGPAASPIPTQRLGALLTSSRVQHGYSVEDLVRRSGGAYSVADLKLVEKGGARLNDRIVEGLCRLYDVDVGTFRDTRSELIVDLYSGRMAVGDLGVDVDLFNGKHGERQVSYILERYLALIYMMRQMEPGQRLTLREPDLEVLSLSLQKEIDDLERLLVAMMGSRGVDERTRALLKRFVVPGAGLMVGAVAAGALVIVSGGPQMGSLTPDDHDHDHDHAAVAFTEDTSATVGQAGRSQAEINALGAQAEAMIGYDWQSQLPDWTVTYMGDSPTYKGLTQRSTKSIVIYVDAGASAFDVAGVLAHEIGHALDVTHLDDDARMKWLDARDMPTVWWAGNGLSDFSVGAGDFAEAVAAAWVGSPSDSTYGDFTPDQLELAQELLP